MIGRLLSRNEIVHHKNNNKHDNSEENLVVMNRLEHIRMHSKKLEKWIESFCPECGLKFRYKRNQRKELKGTKNKFCSRRCNGLFIYKNYAENFIAGRRGKSSISDYEDLIGSNMSLSINKDAEKLGVSRNTILNWKRIIKKRP